MDEHQNETINQLFRGSNRQLAVDLIGIIDDLSEYWPLTVRQIYYRAVAALLVSNNQSEYRRIGKLLVDLRADEIVPWTAIDDRTRTTSEKRGMSNLQEYLQGHLETVLNPEYYGRCYIQDQPVYAEISVEKDALLSVVRDAAYVYCTRVSVTRGQPSATLVNKMAERFDRALSLGKEPVLLHFGDLDPTGVQIPASIQSTLLERHGLHVAVRQIALTPAQCVSMDLPQSLDAAKEGDPNFERWIQKFGDQAPTELDAMHPAQLQRLVDSTLRSVYDMEGFFEQVDEEKEERRTLRRMRDVTIRFLQEQFPSVLNGVQLSI